MIRFCISPIIGTGGGEDSFRAAVLDVANINTSAIIPTDNDPQSPDYGKPKYNFALCIVAAANFAPVAQVSNLYLFPDYNLDGRMDGMEAEARTGMVQSVEAYDLDGEGLFFDASHDDGESYRQVLDRIGKQLEPAFNINNFGTGEVAQ